MGGAGDADVEGRAGAVQRSASADRRDLAQLVELEQERSLETSAKIAASRARGGLQISPCIHGGSAEV